MSTLGSIRLNSFSESGLTETDHELTALITELDKGERFD